MKPISMICLVVFFLAACGTPAAPPATTVLPTAPPAVLPTTPPTEAPPTATALPTGGRIEGQVYKDPGHKILAGVTVTLADPVKREAVALAKSDASGNYLLGRSQAGQVCAQRNLGVHRQNRMPGREYVRAFHHSVPKRGWHVYSENVDPGRVRDESRRRRQDRSPGALQPVGTPWNSQT